MSRRKRHPKMQSEDTEAVELPERYFVELVDAGGKVLSSEGRSLERKGRSAFNRARTIYEGGGYAEDVVKVRLMDRETSTILYTT